MRDLEDIRADLEDARRQLQANAKSFTWLKPLATGPEPVSSSYVIQFAKCKQDIPRLKRRVGDLERELFEARRPPSLNPKHYPLEDYDP